MQALLYQRVPAEDGAELATDVWLPSGPGPFAVLLTRTPYHRANALAKAKLYTGWGYAYVIHDTQGKYDSTGRFQPLIDEARDGAATLDWIANQSWCNGRIGMVGASYLGIVQIPAASCGHPALKCIAPAVAPNSNFIDWLRYDGCFALANAVRWPMTHAICPTKPVLDHYTWDELYAQPTLDAVFERVGYECQTLREWVEHDVYDDYWRAVDQHLMYPGVRCPGLHVGGWFDHLTRGQFQAYQGIRNGGEQRLLIGPWGHSTIGQSKYGQWDFGPSAALPFAEYERRFVDLHLRDIDDGLGDEPGVKVFVMGANRWEHFAQWPPVDRAQAWHLRSAGNAKGLGGDGKLSLESPAQERPDRYTYDPSDPVPTLGGPIYWGLADAGPQDQRGLLYRDDVLYYRSDPLPEPVFVAGEIDLDLWIATDASDTDFVAKLCVVEPPGRVTVLAHGSLRCRYREGWDRCVPLEADSPVRIRIQMGNLAYVFPSGSRVALMVTSSCFPRILPHPNTMAPTWQERSPQVAAQQVLHDREHPSRLLLPVVG